ncbi:hypothetical protein ABW20_dc0101462 [Dactylellina cionopaga]|nr:hypothetical protein ABW20_dc0101462 [Dactylellina cionopaga]
MVQRKRAAGTAAKRKSSRNQKPVESESEAQDAAVALQEPHAEQTESLPRKKAKTKESTTIAGPTQEGILESGLIEDTDTSIPHATSPDDASEERDASRPPRSSSNNSQPQLTLDTINLNHQNGSTTDVPMQDDSPTTEVSSKLENVDIKTPRKRIQPTLVTKSTRSTRSKDKECNDVNMTDELASMATPEPRRSGRTRKANPMYDEDDYLESAAKFLELPPPKPKAKAAGKSSKTGIWSANHLLTSKRSKIISAECNAIFNESTWGLFSDGEKKELLGLLHPIDTEITDPDQDPAEPPPRIPTPILFQNLNNDAFRTAFAELQDDLATGSYEPAYIKKAEEAMRLRIGPMADKIDDMKNKEFEEYWGQKQAVFFGDAGQSANVTLYELCQHKMFKPGDVFEYKRTFQKTLTVEKICVLDKVELLEDGVGVRKKKDACTFTFRYPSGTGKFLRRVEKDGDDAPGESTAETGKDEKDITIKVNNFAQFEVALLDEDGTVKASDPEKYKQYPNANAWKMFVVRRNDEFLGSPFTIRQNYYEKAAANSSA